MNYNQLTEYERVQIHTYLSIGLSQRDVAREINRSNSTISREIRRNGINNNNGIVAHQKAINRITNAKQIDINRCKEFLEFFCNNFDKRLYGPATLVNIAKRRKLFKNIPSHQTLYNWINQELIKITKRMLLRSSNKYKRRMFKWNKPSKLQKIPISLRPKIINQRQEIGYWEGDSVTMANSAHRVMTIVERVTRYAVTIKVNSGNMNKNHQTIKVIFNDN